MACEEFRCGGKHDSKKHTEFLRPGNTKRCLGTREPESFRCVSSGRCSKGLLSGVPFYAATLKICIKKREKYRSKPLIDRFDFSVSVSCLRTAIGAAKRTGMGNLCYGWSVVPVYYYRMLC